MPPRNNQNQDIVDDSQYDDTVDDGDDGDNEGEPQPDTQRRGVSRSEDTDDDGEADDDIDWKAEAEKQRAEAESYKRRYGGANQRIQKEVEARRAAEANQEQLANLAAQAQIAQLPEEQQAYAYQLYMQDQAARRLTGEREVEQAAMIAVLKEHKANQLAQENQLNRDYLMQFDTPDQMDAAAAAVIAERKRTGKQSTRESRRVSGADRFEGGGTPRAVAKAPETFEEARAAMKRYVAQSGRSRRR